MLSLQLLLRIYILTYTSLVTGFSLCGGYTDQSPSCYQLFTNPLSWQDAQNSCYMKGGGHLATVTSHSDQIAIETLLMSTSPVRSTSLWLGGRLENLSQPFSLLWRWLQDEEIISAQGCYLDDNTHPDLTMELIITSLTPDKCITACQQQSFLYAGVQDGWRCFCGNSYGRYGPVNTLEDTNNCMTSCVGDSSQRCGSSGRNFIYAVSGGYSLWGYYRPNDFGGYQTCALLSPDVSYKFDDDNCGQTLAGYICQLSEGADCSSSYSAATRMIGDTCYYISNVTRTWFQARADCLQLQGELARIGSVVIFNDILKQIQTTAALKYWIGLVAAFWRWTDGSEIIYTNWYSDPFSDSSNWQPADVSNKCLALNTTLHYQWASANCNQAYAYICQAASSQTTASSISRPAMNSTVSLTTTTATTITTTRSVVSTSSPVNFSTTSITRLYPTAGTTTTGETVTKQLTDTTNIATTLHVTASTRLTSVASETFSSSSILISSIETRPEIGRSVTASTTPPSLPATGKSLLSSILQQQYTTAITATMIPDISTTTTAQIPDSSPANKMTTAVTDPSTANIMTTATIDPTAVNRMTTAATDSSTANIMPTTRIMSSPHVTNIQRKLFSTTRTFSAEIGFVTGLTEDWTVSANITNQFDHGQFEAENVSVPVAAKSAGNNEALSPPIIALIALLCAFVVLIVSVVGVYVLFKKSSDNKVYDKQTNEDDGEGKPEEKPEEPVTSSDA